MIMGALAAIRCHENVKEYKLLHELGRYGALPVFHDGKVNF